MKLFNMLWWLSLFMLHVDDDDAVGDGVTDDDLDPDKAKDDQGGKPEEPASLLDAVQAGIDEMNKPEPDDKTKGAPKEDDKPEVKPEDDKAKPDAKPDPKAEGDDKDKPALTDDDLAMPEGLSKRGQERFQKLASGYKEIREQHDAVQAELATLRTEHEQVAAANTEFVTAMESVGATPESLTTFMDYMAMMKAGDYDKAQALLQAELENIATLTGKEIPGADLLKKYPDLLDDVDNFKLTKERALEIAAARRRQETAQQTKDAGDRRNDEQRRNTETQNAALAEIDKAFKRLSNTDVDFKRKEAMILAKQANGRSMLEEVIQEFPPSLWVKQLDLIYRSIRIEKQPAQSGNTPNPLRPSNGGGEAEPGSMLEAMSIGLGYTGS